MKTFSILGNWHDIRNCTNFAVKHEDALVLCLQQTELQKNNFKKYYSNDYHDYVSMSVPGLSRATVGLGETFSQPPPPKKIVVGPGVAYPPTQPSQRACVSQSRADNVMSCDKFAIVRKI